jgi:cobaltochelatase CobS
MTVEREKRTMQKALKDRLLSIPNNTIIGATIAHGAPSHFVTKLQRVDWLGEQIENGRLTFDQVANAKPVINAPANTAIDTAKLDAIESVANRAHAYALQGLDLSRGIEGSVMAVAGDVANMRMTLDQVAKAQAASLVDDTKVAADVANAVAKAFAPFKQAVIDAGAEQAVASGVAATVVDRKTALQVFGVQVLDSKGLEMYVDLWNASDAPAIDPNFVWSPEILKHLLLSQYTGENLWFGGEKGTGKSETARQFAARTGRSYTRINFHKYTTTEDYAGSVGLENGATVFKRGSFLTAFACPSSIILLDEISNCDAGELATLNGFLEPNSAVNFGGQVHRRARGVMVFAADNTLTNGDQSGRYAGTRPMNSSLADRFARVIKFEYLSANDEAEALIRHTGCHQALATHVVAAINAARAKVETGDVIDAPSIRSAIAFIRSLNVLSVDEAWHSAITSRQPSESAAALDAIKAAYINPADVAQWI